MLGFNPSLLRNVMRELDSAREEVERAFGETGSWSFPFSRMSFLPGRGTRSYPLVNVREDDEKVTIEALAPGVAADAFDVSVTGKQISISGEKTPSGNENINRESFHRNERSAGKFVRTFCLNTEVDQDNVEAKYSNGLLTISLKKAETAKPRQIEIKVE